MTPAAASVLIVDDEPAVRELMARWVRSLGLCPHTAASADEALETLRTAHYDLAVIDVMMPGHDGLWLATELRREHPHTAVVIATAYSELLAQDGGDTQRVPIADFLVKPFQRDRFELALDRGRQWRKHALRDVEWHAQLSIELQDRLETICTHVATRAAAGERESDALVAYSNDRLHDTMAHAERVARYAVTVARFLELADAEIAAIEIAARFHDVGKAAMPEALLTKPSPLTSGEMAIMRRHVDIGADILDSTSSLRAAAPLVMASHEWFGGGGYPRKLRGSAIPLGARIIAVVDAYDAMTQDRAYRVRFDSTDAIAELLRCCPAQFDADIVSAFLTVLGRH